MDRSALGTKLHRRSLPRMETTSLRLLFFFCSLKNSETVGGHYHTASGNPKTIVRGRFGSRQPDTGRVEETVYTAGPRGWVWITVKGFCGTSWTWAWKRPLKRLEEVLHILKTEHNWVLPRVTIFPRRLMWENERACAICVQFFIVLADLVTVKSMYITEPWFRTWLDLQEQKRKQTVLKGDLIGMIVLRNWCNCKCFKILWFTAKQLCAVLETSRIFRSENLITFQTGTQRM